MSTGTRGTSITVKITSGSGGMPITRIDIRRPIPPSRAQIHATLNTVVCLNSRGDPDQSQRYTQSHTTHEPQVAVENRYLRNLSTRVDRAPRTEDQGRTRQKKGEEGDCQIDSLQQSTGHEFPQLKGVFAP